MHLLFRFRELTQHAAEYFLWACDNNPELQKPLVKAHVQAALLEGCVQVAEEVEVDEQTSGFEVCRTIVGVALWCVLHYAFRIR
jgi:hypothetical protein